MRSRDMDATLRAWTQARGDQPVPPSLREQILVIPSQTPRQRAWLPQIPKWRFQSMFSATKFVVAGVIVALFGGFLLTGILTQPSDEVVPAIAASASASAQVEPTVEATTKPETSPEAATTQQTEVITRSDLLQGVDLVTEEVELGVFRVVNDGVRELTWPADRKDLYLNGVLDRSIAAGPDGSVWLFWPNESFRLGQPGSTRWGRDPLPWGTEDIEIAPDGTVLRVRSGLRYLDQNDQWQSAYEGSFLDIEAAPDGTLWGVWPNRYRCRKNTTGAGKGCASYVSRLDLRDNDDTVGHASPAFKNHRYAGVIGFWVTDDGTIWLWDMWEPTKGGRGKHSLTRSDGRVFERIDLPSGIRKSNPISVTADMNADGTLWAQAGPAGPSTLARFDGTRWTTFDESDGVPPLGGHYQGHPGFLRVAPDGSVWVNPLGDWEATGNECDGVASFDGEAWDRYLRGICIYAMDVAPDGNVWLQAGVMRHAGSGFEPVEVYVITPEAVAATE